MKGAKYGFSKVTRNKDKAKEKKFRKSKRIIKNWDN